MSKLANLKVATCLKKKNHVSTNIPLLSLRNAEQKQLKHKIKTKLVNNKN